MPEEALERSVMSTLSGISHPETGRDIVASGHVRNLSVEEGEVRFSFFLGPDDPGSLVKDAREAVEALDGVGSVRVNVQLPQTAGDRPNVPGSGGGAPAGGGPGGAGPAGPGGAGPGAAGPGAGGPGGGGGLKPGSVPAPTPRPGILSDVDRVVAVSSGKGGVGKSMVAANLAAALASGGHRVGLLDADVYGPNIPRMFGVDERPRVTGSEGSERIEPLEGHGVRLMSLGFLLEEDQPAIMRGPLISGILKQFLEQVEWGELDYLIVDMPPGTGDAQLSLVQTIDVDGVVMVTTPQEMATGDVRRGVRMFERVNTRVLGIAENMSGYTCPHCGETEEIFGTGGGSTLAEELGLPLLARIPLDPAVRTAGDEGIPTVVNAPGSGAGEALLSLSEEVDRVLEPAPAG